MKLRHPLNACRRQLLWAASAAGLAGCSGLLPKPPEAPARHVLDAGVATPPATRTPPPRPPAGGQALLVAQPRAAPGYGSARMLYLQRAQELQAFAFNEWVEAPAQLLAPMLVRALQDSGAFAVVLQAPTAAVAGLRLETEIVRLHQDFSTQPSQLRLTLRAVLLDTRTRQAIAWREFDDNGPAASDDPAGGVRAAQQAAQRVLAALAAWVAAGALDAVRVQR